MKIQEDKNREKLERVLALLMLWGVLVAAAVMFLGGVVYLLHHFNDVPGDHVFQGEPQSLRNPLLILINATECHTRSIIQLGVVLLLLNPLFRVALAFFGYLREKDFAYIGISAFLVLILVYSFFA